ncbi:MAG: hypothetical protein JRG71_10465 [Deltaproteobacteria bacterium]|nr:hypothetical protein [Deltaproteobacteria bacterium]
MNEANQSHQQTPVTLILSDRSKATIESLKTRQSEIERIAGQITKVDQLIDDTYSEIDQLKEKPCVPSIADQVDSLLGGTLDLPPVDVGSELQREAMLKQKQDLLKGLSNRRKDLQEEQNTLYRKVYSSQDTLSSRLLEDWVGSLTVNDKAIFFLVLEKHYEARSRGTHHVPFRDQRPVDYDKKAKEFLVSVVALTGEKP